MSERFEVQRTIPADTAAIFLVVCDPKGHVAIDATGMLQSATGEPAGAVGDTFVIHMDRESLGDRPMGKYDVTVTITGYEQDRFITWEVSDAIRRGCTRSARLKTSPDLRWHHKSNAVPYARGLGVRIAPARNRRPSQRDSGRRPRLDRARPYLRAGLAHR